MRAVHARSSLSTRCFGPLFRIEFPTRVPSCRCCNDASGYVTSRTRGPQGSLTGNARASCRLRSPAPLAPSCSLSHSRSLTPSCMQSVRNNASDFLHSRKEGGMLRS